MKKLLSCIVLTTTILFPISASAESGRICTREPGSRVTLREKPGTDQPRGLVQVGSGGIAVYNSFKKTNFTAEDGVQVSIFSTTRGTDGKVWHKVGTNQWVAWVHSDFVCQSPRRDSKPPASRGVIQLPKSTGKTCQQAIDFVKQDLLRRGYFSPYKIPGEPGVPSTGRVVNPSVSRNKNLIPESFYNYPANRTEAVVFVLTDAQAGSSILALYDSPQIMATLAAQIIAACDQVGLVKFSYWFEGGIPVGYFPDNTVRVFTVFNPGTPEEKMQPYQKTVNTPSGEERMLYQWGYDYSL